MEEETRPDSPTLRQHKRQLVWQIILPFVLMGALIVAAAVLTAFGNDSPTSLWRDVSLIWLLAPALVLALIGVVILGAAIYGMARLKKAAPRVTGRAQELTLIGARGIKRIADGTTQPFLWLGQAGAAVRSIFTRRGGKNRPEG